MSVPWHALNASAVLSELRSAPDGLTGAEADERLRRHGPNRLPRARPASAMRILGSQVANLVSFLLILAAGVSLALGDLLEAAAILGVLVLNITIGFVVELRARRAMEALSALEVENALVVRDGRTSELPAYRIVPGDVVELVPGDRVPADARLLRAVELRVNEAPLTGESFPVEKNADDVLTDATAMADRINLVFSGTAILSGAARAVVVATGAQTEVGRIGRLVAAMPEEKTPLERKLDGLGRRLALAALGVAVLVFVTGWLRGFPPAHLFTIAIALAIAAVPEGLPAVATITLAIGLRRMARRHALVRRLHAVEALGSVTVVCTDKTGTLTSGVMTVTDLWMPDQRIHCERGEHGLALESDGQRLNPASDERVRELLRAAALSARVELGPTGDLAAAVGDPTDAALVVGAAEAGFDRSLLLTEMPLLEEIPFSAARRFTASFHREPDGGIRAFVKGAPEAVIARCSGLSAAERSQALVRNEELAAAGLRVIALASARVATPAESELNALTLLGLTGLSDPIAPDVPATIKRLSEAGIRMIVLTGDHKLTAVAVSRALGLLHDDAAAIESRQLQQMTDAQLTEVLKRTAVFSRVEPTDKLRIVELLQRQGDIVAMLGDGVNDAIALKKADVGVAMGRRGTDAARETATVVLQDDQFATIAVAVEQGRVIYDNIRRFILYLFSCNFAEILVILAATLAGWPLPILPLQILWLNLVTDTFPAFALAFEPREPDIMQRGPRDPGAAILSRRFAVLIVGYGALLAVATLAVLLWGLWRGEGPATLATYGFMTLALVQVIHVGNARSRFAVVLPRRIVANPYALAALVLVVALQLAAIYWPPLARMLSTVRPEPAAWLVIVGAALSVGVIGQALKILEARRHQGSKTVTLSGPVPGQSVATPKTRSRTGSAA